MLAILPDSSIGPVDLPPIGYNQALIKVECFSLSKRDVEKVRPPKFAIDKSSIEFSGTIFALPNSEISVKFEEGQRVAGYTINGGACAEYVACDLSCLLKIPHNMSFEQAATIPYAWIVGADMLKFCGQFRQREQLVIRNGYSDIGHACAILAQLMGCRRVHVEVQTKKEGVKAHKQFKLKGSLEDEIIISLPSTLQSNLDYYSGSKVDCVLDFHHKPEINSDLAVLGNSGRAVIHSYPGASEPIDLPLVFTENLQMIAYRFRNTNPKRLGPARDYVEEHVLPKIMNHQIKSPTYQVFIWHDFNIALQMAHDLEHHNQKIVVKVNDFPNQRSSSSFAANWSYTTHIDGHKKVVFI